MLKKTMNNKGFTLIEVLAIVTMIMFICGIIINMFGTTMSLSQEEEYKLMKDNIISAGYSYVNECTQDGQNCDFSYEKNNTFKAKILKNVGLFDNLESPIDGKDLSECLILEATKNNGITIVNLIDNCY